MSKVIAAILLIAAFGYALYLRVFRQSVPKPDKTNNGVSRRFFMATVLFSGFLGCQPATIYREPVTTEEIAEKKSILATIKVIWINP